MGEGDRQQSAVDDPAEHDVAEVRGRRPRRGVVQLVAPVHLTGRWARQRDRRQGRGPGGGGAAFPAPSRRVVLATLAAVPAALATGCVARGDTTDRPPDRPLDRPPDRPDRPPTGPDRAGDDERIRAESVTAEIALVAAHRACTGRFPALRRRLAPVLAEHEAHLAALGGTVPAASPTAAGPGTANPSTAGPGTAAGTAPSTAGPAASTAPSTAGPAATPSPLGHPRSATDAVARLVVLEHRAATDRVDAVADASPALARLLAGIGGSEAAHAALLEHGT